jgi:hypothetical protein
MKNVKHPNRSNRRKNMEQRYRIAFRSGDSSFEIETTDPKWLEKKEKEYLERLAAGKGRKRPQEAIEAGREVPTPDVSINEFFRKYIGQKHAKSRTNIAVFFVYYLEKVMKKGEITTGDVGDCFKQVSYPNWNKINFTDILRRARRRAFLNCVNRLWSLTTTGEDFVLNAITGKEE